MEKLKRRTIMTYALPAIPISALGLPLVVHLPPFYASVTGLSLTVIGIVFMVLRLWDVITDPLMGWAGDRFEMKGGKRRGWIILSVPILMLSSWMVFSPPQEVGWEYLFYWMMMLYIGWTMITISHMSWGAELSTDYHDRSRVHGIREAFLILGMLAVLALPVWVEYNAANELRPGEAGIKVMGLFIVVLLPITVLLAVWRVGEKTGQRVKLDWRATLAAFKKNRALRYLLASDLLLSFAAGTVSSMFLLLTLHVLSLDRLTANVMLLLYFAMGIVFVPLVLKLADSVGKHWAQFISSSFTVLTVPFILIVPMGNTQVAFITWSLLGMNMAAGATLLRSMMADVSDVDELELGSSRMATFYSLLTMTSKMGYALAIGLTYPLLDYLGFQAGGTNSEEVLFYVREIYVVIPFVLNLLVMALMFYYPISRRKQEENRRLIELAAKSGAASTAS